MSMVVELASNTVCKTVLIADYMYDYLEDGIKNSPHHYPSIELYDGAFIYK